MTKENAIKYLQQVYPEGGHCWLDKQRIEAISMAIEALREEPVSEDLEEACDSYYDETWDEHGGRAMVVDGCHDIWFPSHATDDFFKAGAEWQEKQDQKTIELAEDHAMLAGMEKMKEQMMKDAIDGQLEDSDDYLRIKCLSTSCKPEDNGKLVKLIIIKED